MSAIGWVFGAIGAALCVPTGLGIVDHLTNGDAVLEECHSPHCGSVLYPEAGDGRRPMPCDCREDPPDGR